MTQSYTAFHTFANNTKQTCLVTALSLFSLLIIMIAPINVGKLYKLIGKILVITMLGYTFLRNCKETNRLVSTIPELFSEQQHSTIKTNTILSYILSISIFVLIIYITYTIIF